MSNTTDMNIVLGQGSAIKEVHNIGRQNLELNQQVVAQKTEDKKKETRQWLRETETEKQSGCVL